MRVATVHDVDHPLGVAVAEVGVVRGSVVDHCLVNRVGRFVRKDARRQTRHHFSHSRQVAGVEDVVVDQHVLPEKVKVGAHVGEQSADLKTKSFKIEMNLFRRIAATHNNYTNQQHITNRIHSFIGKKSHNGVLLSRFYFSLNKLVTILKLKCMENNLNKLYFVLSDSFQKTILISDICMSAIANNCFNYISDIIYEANKKNIDRCSKNIPHTQKNRYSKMNH